MLDRILPHEFKVGSAKYGKQDFGFRWQPAAEARHFFLIYLGEDNLLANLGKLKKALAFGLFLFGG